MIGSQLPRYTHEVTTTPSRHSWALLASFLGCLALGCTDDGTSDSTDSTESSATDSTGSTDSTSESETGSEMVSCADFGDQAACESAMGAISEDIETDCEWLPIYEMVDDGACSVSATDRGLCLAVSGNDSGCETLSNACGVDLLEVYFREIEGAVELVYDPDATCRGPGSGWTDCLDDGMGGVENPTCGCACDFVP